MMPCFVLEKVTIFSLLCSDLTQEKVPINLLTGMLSINSYSKIYPELWTFFKEEPYLLDKHIGGSALCNRIS